MAKSQAWTGEPMVLLRSPFLLTSVSVAWIEMYRQLYGIAGLSVLMRTMGLDKK